MTVRQAAAALDVSRRLAYRMIGSGALPCYRFGAGRKIVITEDHVNECRRRHESGVERDGGEGATRGGGKGLRVPDFNEIVEAVGKGRG